MVSSESTDQSLVLYLQVVHWWLQKSLDGTNWVGFDQNLSEVGYQIRVQSG